MFGLVSKRTIEKKIDARIAEVKRLAQYYPKEGVHIIANFKGLKKDFDI